MSSKQSSRESVDIAVENVGGIDRTRLTFSPGVTVLAGRNATNRTSLLQAIMAGLGSEDVSLKGDAEEGRVDLEVDGETHTRTLRRTNGGVVAGGDPYLDDPELADLFAFLLESNEARRAVARGDDLREIIMRPVDTEAIQSEIDRFEEEKRRVDSRLDELSSLKQRLPGLEEQRADLEGQIEDKREELEAKEAEIDEFDADIDETREEKEELDDRLEELRDARSSLEDVRFSIDSEQKSLEALREEREELETDREELPDAPVGEIEEIDAEIERLRDRQRSIDSTVSELQTVIQFNEEMLEGTNPEIFAALRDEEGRDGSVTDRLVEDETVVCWTCGSEVERSQIEDTLDRLRSLRQDKLDERSDLRDEISDLEDEKIVYEEKERQREQIQRRLDRVEHEIERREGSLADLRSEREELEARVETLEGEVEALEREEYTDILDLHKEANQLEFELGRLQSDLEDVEDEIATIEEQVEERERLRERREEIGDELEDLRTRIDRIEAEAVEQFNEHMDAVLDILDYANLDRIWIERTEREVREGRRRVTERALDLHVIRSTDEGTTYEDTVDHLSESEREVTGLVFALAGYLVHEVHETVPFMLLDSLEAIDSGRIAALVEYLDDYADYLVVALLPEDAAALDDSYRRVSEI